MLPLALSLITGNPGIQSLGLPDATSGATCGATSGVSSGATSDCRRACKPELGEVDATSGATCDDGKAWNLDLGVA